MNDPDRTRPTTEKVTRAEMEGTRATLAAWVLPPWTDEIPVSLLREQNTRRLREFLTEKRWTLTLWEVACLRAQRGISSRA